MSKATQYYKKYDVPASLSRASLQKIILFYLLNCPVKGKSYRGKTFKEYGFSGSPAFSKLKSVMLKNASKSLKNNYIPCKKGELDYNFKSIESVSPPEEYCVFLYNDEKTKIESLFSAIRNALAHGSFNCKSYNGTKIYFFLNYDGYRKAQIVLHETTLLNWISVIENGYSKLIGHNNTGGT